MISSRVLLFASLVSVICFVDYLLADDRPNFLLITADDLGLQLSCYGDTYIETPHLDQLASEGVIYRTAYVTQASCSSSRSSMLSGMYPHTTGQVGLANAGFTLAEEEVGKNLFRYLKDDGYRIGILGKLHVAPETSFPIYFRPKGQDTRDVRAVAANAAEFLGSESGEPFFLMVNYSDPHVWKEPNGHRGFPPQWKGLPPDPIPVDAVPGWPFQGIDEPVARRRVSNYYNTVKRLDIGVGLLLEELEKSGFEENTIIVFLGDHGPPFNRGKTTCYESGLRVPFLLRWPGMSKAGVESDALVSATDIVPTFLDAAGIEFPREFHGRSLRPTVLTDEAPVGWRSYLAAEFHFHGYRPFFPRRAITDGRFKLIHNPLAGAVKPNVNVDGDPTAKFAESEAYRDTPAGKAHQRYSDPPEWELYDLENDPVEFINLADEAEHSDQLKELQEALLSWQQATDDPLLTEEGTEALRLRGVEAEKRDRR